MQKLSSIQALRGVAAVFVLLYHTTAIYITSGLPTPYLGVFIEGDKGVDVFFVLSGFIMVYVHRRDLGSPQRFPRYLYTRMVRIYPTMWIVSVLAIVIYALHFNGSKLGKLQPVDLICSLLLLPQTHVPLTNVTWTLVYEVIFYLLFGAAILNRRAGLAILAIWQLAIIAIFVARIDTSAPAMLVFRSLALEFGLGMLVGWLVTTAPKIPTAAARVTAWGCVAFGAALIPISATLLAQAPRFSTFGVAGALLVYGFATLERGDLIRAPGWMEQIGDASYAVYLIHFSAITLLVTVLTHMHVKGFAVYLAPLVSAFGFLVGEGFYLLVDKPLGRALRLPLRPRPNAQPAT